VTGRRVLAIPRGTLEYVPQVTDRGVGVLVRSGDRDRVMWVGSDRRRYHAVARSARGWWIDSFAASDGWLVWVEKSKAQYDDPATPVSWRIHVYNFRTRRTRLLQRSRHTTALAPDVSVLDGTLLFSTYRGLAAGTVDIWKQGLAGGHKNIVAMNVHDSGFVATGHGIVVGIIKHPRSDHSSTDLFVYRSGHRRRLTHTGDVCCLQYADHELVWSRTNFEHHDRVMARRWPAGKIHRLLTQDDALVSLGDGFITDERVAPDGLGYQPLVIGTAPPYRRIKLKNPRGTTMPLAPSAGGHTIAWVITRVSKSGRYEGPQKLVRAVVRP
jgi:hypothetical protein